MSDLKTFSELHRVIDAERRAEESELKRERLERKSARADESVVCGAFRPEPIDRAAAMLLSRAPWYAHAPSVRQEPKQEIKIMPEKATYVENLGECLNIGKERVFPRKHNGELMYSVEDMAKALIAHAKTIDPELEKISVSAADCRKAIDESIADVGSSVREFDRVTKDGLSEIRMKRMTIISECASMVNAMRDVRQFFLGPDYDREQKRLVEFVDLCERLKRLKDSGFLDTVADTMIRLAAYEK
jgi:hypothetical protein